jgi:cytochrome c oxidase assembly factor CtaG
VIQHLEAILIIIGQLAVWAFYALFAVAGVVLAINFMLELLYKRRRRRCAGRMRK